MKIEMLEGYKYDHGNGLHVLEAEDHKTVDDSFGKMLCDMGFAKDLSGEYPTAKRDTNRTIRLQPDNVRSQQPTGEG